MTTKLVRISGTTTVVFSKVVELSEDDFDYLDGAPYHAVLVDLIRLGLDLNECDFHSTHIDTIKVL